MLSQDEGVAHWLRGDMNWNQSGMPAALVNRLGQRRELAEFRSVLNDAQNQIVHPVDAESMAQELVKSGGREVVAMVKELSAALASARQELEDANRRYERLVADLGRRGISLEAEAPAQPVAPASSGESPDELPSAKTKPEADDPTTWEEWDLRFKALLG